MKILDAMKRVEKSEEFSKFKDFFLASAFVCIAENEEVKSWTLLFYNKSRHVTIDVFVNDKFVTFSEETQAMNEFKKLTIGKIIPVEKVMEMTREKIRSKIVNILITLVMSETTIWKISYITADISATSFELDASDGKILKEDKTSLLANLDR